MIILINGSINSGKTTISKELVKHIDKCAHIEIDSLRAFISNTPLQEAIPINIENAILIAKNLLKHKYNIIISYVLPREIIEKIVSELKSLDQEIYLFSLSPRLEKVLQNRGFRELDHEEIERIKYHYEKSYNDPGIGIIIDNSELNVEQTLELVLKNINQRNFLKI